MGWRPELPDGESLHERLAAALQRDVGAGVLQPGERLPPQRVLAERLRMSIGTVTKAFREAERLGLVSGEVGRGTFVTGGGAAAQEFSAGTRAIDLSVNTTPYEEASRRFAGTLRRLLRRPNVLELLAYAPPAGIETHRRAAGAWLARTARFDAVDSSRLILTCGGQQAMTLAFAVLCRPGDVILCEAATYYGMRALAEQAGYVLHGVAMDGEGVSPAALDKAAAETGARVAYLMPTVQVPTARTMGATRRADIIAVARKRRLHIVEDDNYAVFAPKGRGFVPLSQLAPDICFYTASVSKTLTPGLRTGFLVAPTVDLFDRVIQALRATVYANGGFGPFVLAQWVEDGSGLAIVEAMIREVSARWKLAAGLLEPLGGAGFAVSPHIWLTLDELETERAAGRAQRAGVTVTPPELPLLDPSKISGLRICLGAPKSRAELAVGLERLRDVLARAPQVPLNALI
jgi:DNA-binding transcriptional MocR family regulator